MSRLKGRLAKLEKTIVPADCIRDSFRLVTSTVGPLNLANSKCRRTLHNGFLWERVELDGNLTDEELNKFIESFPIETGSAGTEIR